MNNSKLVVRIPEPGAHRMIPSRHPLQVSFMIAFILSSVLQLTNGFVIGSVAIVASTVLTTVLIASIVGSTLCIISAIVAEKNPWEAIGLSLGGFFILTAALLFSSGLYVANVPEWWLVEDFWINLVFVAGFGVRFFQLLRDAWRIWFHRGRMRGHLND